MVIQHIYADITTACILHMHSLKRVRFHVNISSILFNCASKSSVMHSIGIYLFLQPLTICFFHIFCIFFKITLLRDVKASDLLSIVNCYKQLELCTLCVICIICVLSSTCSMNQKIDPPHNHRNTMRMLNTQRRCLRSSTFKP